MTKERMKDLLIIGMLPFVVVVYETTNWDFLRVNPELQKRDCVVYHENAPVHLKCQETYEQECPYSHGC